MAKKYSINKPESIKKKTSIGRGKYSKTGTPGPNGGNKKYPKPYRGQGR